MLLSRAYTVLSKKCLCYFNLKVFSQKKILTFSFLLSINLESYLKLPMEYVVTKYKNMFHMQIYMVTNILKLNQPIIILSTLPIYLHVYLIVISQRRTLFPSQLDSIPLNF